MLRTIPELSDWPLPPRAGAGRSLDQAARHAVVELVNRNAARLGTGRVDDAAAPLIFTGHQAFFWHGGILAKDLCAAAAAARCGGAAVHVVVDQDEHPATTLDVPATRGDALEARTLTLAPQRPGLPTGAHPPVEWRLDAPALPPRVAEALTGLPPCRSLAEQVTVALHRLRSPYTAAPQGVVFASQLQQAPGFAALVERMRNDARACAQAYNSAAAETPEAGIAPLRLTRELVELPLWTLRPGQPRRRVYADVADSDALLVHEDGGAVTDDTDATLAPRALTLTGFLRAGVADLFIHGTGGGVYDRVTESWWRRWRGEALTPMVVATADLRLDFGVPVASAADLARARWYRHHLPHNVDRYAHLRDGSRDEKRELLQAMGTTTDRARRAALFHDLHRLNEQLVAAHPDLLAAADRQLQHAAAGVRNAAVARRRDWSFALAPPQELRALAQGAHAMVSPLPPGEGGESSSRVRA